MAEKQTIVINDIEYTEDQLTDQQKVIINHIADLDRKIRSTQFNLDQLTVGKDAFVNMLTLWLSLSPTGVCLPLMATTLHLLMALRASPLTLPRP
jgi:hypothetical protein